MMISMHIVSPYLMRAVSELNSLRSRFDHSRFFYHFTEMSNIPSILEHNRLYSRYRLNELGIQIHDSASSRIIGSTADEKKHFVRLYFRPLVPTQYWNEGFVPKGHRYQGSHCPRPVFLLFDPIEIMKIDNVMFTDGNLASPEVVEGGLEMFPELNFDDIYSSHSEFKENRKKKYRSQAEVLVREELGLDPLTYIVCRSRAEHATLQYRIHSSGLDRWCSKVILYPRLRLFYERYLFVRDVMLNVGSMLIDLNIDGYHHDMDVEVQRLDDMFILRRRYSDIRCPVKIIDPFFRPGQYHLKIVIDSYTAYENILTISE